MATLIHIGPPFYAESYNINTSTGDWSLEVYAPDTGGWFKFKMSFYAVYNDGSYELLATIGNNSDDLVGKSWSLSGTLSKMSEKDSVRFSMYCNSEEHNVECETTGKGFGYMNKPGVAFGSTFTLYSAPSNYNVYIDSRTTTSITAYHTWKEGSKSITTHTLTVNGVTKSVKEGKDNAFKFTDLTPNKKYTITGKISDGQKSLTNDKRFAWTNLAAPNDLVQTAPATNVTDRVIVRAKSANGTAGNNGDGLKYTYKLSQSKEKQITAKYGAGNEVTFTGLAINTKYTISVTSVNSNNGFYNADGEITSATGESSAAEFTAWTRPKIQSVSVGRPAGSEHNSFTITVNAINGRTDDLFAIKLDDDSFVKADYVESNTKTFTGLEPNKKYTVYAKMKNGGGYVSEPVPIDVYTWHSPLSDVKVNLVKNWFWSLQLNAKFTNPSNVPITKYEFSIGGESYNSTGVNNSYTKGSTIADVYGNLEHNTNYTCKVRISVQPSPTQEPDVRRAYEATATYKTLDARPLYVDGSLKEVDLIKLNGLVYHVTPDLLTVITPDGTKINMNDIINPNRVG